MFLSDLKQDMFLPKKEIFINKIIKIRGTDVQLISITSEDTEDNKNILWVMYSDERIDSEERITYPSNRDEMINNITQRMSFLDMYISEITIQNQKMTFTSTRSSRLYNSYDINYKKYMQMQHFMENGMVTTNWNDVDLADIVIVAYEQEENEEFPTIDLSKELDITLKIRSEIKQILINQPISIEVGEKEKKNKFYFYDSIEKKNRTFYINKMKNYDIWEDVNNNLEDELMQVLPKEEAKQLKEQYIDGLDKICPIGMTLALLEYETEDGIQLDFYSKEYLDEISVSKDSVTIMFFKPDEKVGINGFDNRVCMIKPVEKDFNGIIDVELFSWYMEIPEEIITTSK